MQILLTDLFWPSNVGSRHFAFTTTSAVNCSFSVSISPTLKNWTQIWTFACKGLFVILIKYHKKWLLHITFFVMALSEFILVRSENISCAFGRHLLIKPVIFYKKLSNDTARRKECCTRILVRLIHELHIISSWNISCEVNPLRIYVLICCDQ